MGRRFSQKEQINNKIENIYREAARDAKEGKEVVEKQKLLTGLAQSRKARKGKRGKNKNIEMKDFLSVLCGFAVNILYFVIYLLFLRKSASH